MKLNELVSGATEKKLPPRMIVHGTHGIGKSTLGASAPAPIFIQTEDGLIDLDVPRFPLAKSIDDVWQYIGMLINEEHKYKSVVIDTIDWFEKLAHQDVLQAYNAKLATLKQPLLTTIDDIGGGWGKGAARALPYFVKLIKGLTKLREDKNMAILLLAHNEVRKYTPPDNEPYERYQIKLHKGAAAMLEEWVDVVSFAHYKVIVNTDEMRAVNNAPQRVIYTQERPAWRAKCRYRNVPEEMPMDMGKILTEIKNQK